MPKKKKEKFDKVKYNAEFNKNNYKRINIYFDPEIADEIEDYCTSKGISKKDFLTVAAMYYIKNEIEIEGLK